MSCGALPSHHDQGNPFNDVGHEISIRTGAFVYGGTEGHVLLGGRGGKGSSAFCTALPIHRGGTGNITIGGAEH